MKLIIIISSETNLLSHISKLATPIILHNWSQRLNISLLKL